MTITTKQALAARKLVGAKLRKAGLPDDLEGFRGESLADKRSAHDAKGAVARIARELLDTMKDSTDETRIAEIESAHDGLMSAFDIIEARIDSLTGNANRPYFPDSSVRGDGGAIEVAEPVQAFALRRGETFSDRIRSTGRMDHASISTGDYLRAIVLGPKTAEERAALAEGTDSAGGYTVPDILSARLIDRMRSASVVMRAGAQTVPLTSDINYIARLATDPAPAWRLEAAAIAESEPTFDRVTLTARSLAVLVKISRELLEDSLNIGTALPNILATALASELDRVALIGSGTAPEPKGVANFAGLTANSFAGGALSTYSDLIKGRTALRTANSDVTAFVMHPRDEGALASRVDGNGQPLRLPPALEGVPMFTTSKLPIDGGVGTNESSILAGDWSKLMIGMRSNIRIEILKELYAANHQYAFVAHLRADVAAENEAAFTVMDGITP